MGWRYEWVGELPSAVYDVLVEMLNADVDRRRIEDEDETISHGAYGDV